MGSAVSAVKAGVATDEIGQLIAPAIRPYQTHPVTAPAFAQRMGLALEEPPYTDIGASFEEGEAYSLRIGATDEPPGSLICSSMIHALPDAVEGFEGGFP